jgi:hypothetical protein
MIPRASIWHSLALGGCLLFTGCYDAHGHGGSPPDARLTDASTPWSFDTSFAPDAWAADASVPWTHDTSFAFDAPADDAGGPCAELFASLRAGVRPEELGCDGRTFPRECLEPVSPCCRLHLRCEVEPGDGGHVVAGLDCEDWCAQGCATYDAEDCALVPGCEWFAPAACGPAPPGVIEGPACIDARGAVCASDAECPDGQRCRRYWINPCAGLPCDACGGDEGRCAY